MINFLICKPPKVFYYIQKPIFTKQSLRLPGIEPGSNAWEASMIAITLQAIDNARGILLYIARKQKKQNSSTR